jgi:RNA polymerase primary sigma factor
MSMVTEDSIEIYLSQLEGELLSADEELRLVEARDEGNRMACDLLVERNLRLTVAIARAYTGNGVPLADLVQAGNLGLMRAAEKYDPELGHRFSAYAAWWIRRQLSRVIPAEGRTIYMPYKVYERTRKLERERTRLQQQLRREDVPATELASALGIDEQQVEALTQLDDAISLDAMLSGPAGEEAPQLAAFLADEHAVSASAEVITHERNARIAELLGGLDEREQFVLALRYGFAGYDEHHFKDIGPQIGMTGEGARRLHNRALAKLAATAPDLADYIA